MWRKNIVKIEIKALIKKETPTIYKSLKTFCTFEKQNPFLIQHRRFIEKKHKHNKAQNFLCSPGTLENISPPKKEEILNYLYYQINNSPNYVEFS